MNRILRYVLIAGLAVGLAISTAAPLWAQSYDAPAVSSPAIPSDASGTYSGAGWRCDVSAQLVPANAGLQPAVGFDCTGPGGRYWGYGGRQQYSYECPRASEYSDATTAALWPAAPPWVAAVGVIAVRGYDPSPPAVLVVDIVAPGQPAARIALGRTAATAVPPAYAYGCTPAGAVRIKRGR